MKVRFTTPATWTSGAGATYEGDLERVPATVGDAHYYRLKARVQGYVTLRPADLIYCDALDDEAAAALAELRLGGFVR